MQISHHHRELVAAESSERIGFSQVVAQPCSHRLQQLVTDRVTQGIVHVLKMIEVEEQHRESGAAAPRK